MKIKSVLFAVVCLAANTLHAATIYWNANTTTPTTYNPSNLLDFDPTMTQFNNNGTTALINASSASTTANYAGASGSNNFGAAARTGALSLSNSAAFGFTLTAGVGETIEISDFSFGSRATGTGPQAFALIVSTVSDFSSGTTTLGTGTLGNNSTWTFNDMNFSPFTSTTSTLYVRLYGYNGAGSATASTANWRVDDVTLTYNVVPESATYALIALTVTGLVIFGRRRRKIEA